MFWETGTLTEDKGKENPQHGHKWTSQDDRCASGVMDNQSRLEQERGLQRDQFNRIFCMIE